jgi:nucleotide-binding universal stress UspA family protein
LTVRHKILVGLNSSPSSWDTLETTLEYAGRFKADVVAVLVESPFWNPGPMAVAMYEQVVQRHAEHLAAKHGVGLTLRIRHGFPAHTLAEQARILGCDLVLVGHTDDTVLRRWWSGSLSERLKHELSNHRALCKVVVARTGRVLDLDEAPPQPEQAIRQAVPAAPKATAGAS